MECKCNKCGMGVTGLTCSKCNTSLVIDEVTSNNNQSVKVAKCPKGCGMIKSPTCCGQDMVCAV